jgi:hypothetical protein
LPTTQRQAAYAEPHDAIDKAQKAAAVPANSYQALPQTTADHTAAHVVPQAEEQSAKAAAHTFTTEQKTKAAAK